MRNAVHSRLAGRRSQRAQQRSAGGGSAPWLAHRRMKVDLPQPESAARPITTTRCSRMQGQGGGWLRAQRSGRRRQAGGTPAAVPKVAPFGQCRPPGAAQGRPSPIWTTQAPKGGRGGPHYAPLAPYRRQRAQPQPAGSQCGWPSCPWTRWRQRWGGRWRRRPARCGRHRPWPWWGGLPSGRPRPARSRWSAS